MSTTPPSVQEIQQTLWSSTIPLEIRLSPSESRTYDLTDPYLIHFPRLSYLPFLLPRLHAFFLPSRIKQHSGAGASTGWFSYEGVPLRWHWPVGLLYDLFSGAEGFGAGSVPQEQISRGARSDDGGKESGRGGEDIVGGSHKAKLPWRLVVHFDEWPDDQLVTLDDEGKVMHDAFINAVKETQSETTIRERHANRALCRGYTQADFLRNSTAKGIMSLSKDDSTKLWKAIEDHDFQAFNSINQKLLDPPGAKLRHIPLKIYLPSAAPSSSSAMQGDTGTGVEANTEPEKNPPSASLRVVQTLVSPVSPPRQLRALSICPFLGRNEPQTLGAALYSLLPSLFPSRRTPTLANPILHGAVVPFSAPLEELMRAAAYADGWLHLGVVMMG